MKQEIRSRIINLFSNVNKRLIKEKKPCISAIVISNREDGGADRTFYQITGSYETNLIYSTAAAFDDGRVVLSVSELEKEEAKKTGLPYKIFNPEGFSIKNLLKTRKYAGIHGKYLSYNLAENIKKSGCHLIDITNEINQFKINKTAFELENLKKACNISSLIANNIPKWIKPGITELELCARVEYEMHKAGSEEPAFPTIVAFGKNSAVPHHRTGNTLLKKGNLVLIDFGASIGKMRSDITRVFVCGKANKSQRLLYEHVLGVQTHALEKLKAGMDGAELSRETVKAANKFSLIKGKKGRMNHSLGHSIGIETHDGCILGGEKAFLVPEGLVTTVEPGIYIPGWGGVRIEDDVLVTKKGIINLTAKAFKDILVEV
ncbi:MAG: M24 family metallopeptidase [bacterium]